MIISSTTIIYFSQAGIRKKVIEAIVKGMGITNKYID